MFPMTTLKTIEQRALDCIECGGVVCDGNDSCMNLIAPEETVTLIKELMKYSETGLTPERVAELAQEDIPKALDRLVEYESLIPIEKAREFAKAYDEERLVVLPCKVGDCVYVIYPDSAFPSRRTVKAFYYTVFWAIHTDDGIWGFDDVGKTVFLTREEAEAALEGKEGEPNERLQV